MELDLKIGFSEIISIVGIFANVGLTIWIVKVIQRNINNKRMLKDHFIQEIKDIRSEYRKHLNSLISGNCRASQIIAWHKLMNTKMQEFTEMVCESKTYTLEKNVFYPFQVELLTIITDCEEYIKEYNSEKNITLSNETKDKIIRFQQEHVKIFNKIIINVNNC